MVGVKDMDIPGTCVDCPFYCGTANGTCLIAANTYSNQTMYDKEFERQDWCPLVEIEESEGKNDE